MDTFPPYTPDPDRYEHMVYARAGRSGLRLPRVSLGLWHNFGDTTATTTQRDILRTAFDVGITHFDLANNYGPPYGAAEANFGVHFARDWRPLRDQLLISSKAGWDMWPGPYGDGGSRKYLVASCDQSLKRMGLDYVDIFYSHRRDPSTPIEETMGALDYIVRSGRALYAGISSYNAADTAHAARVLRQLGTPLTIHQPRYSLFDRWIERPGAKASSSGHSLQEVLAGEGVGTIVFSPLEQGLLTDRYLDGIPSDSRAGRDGRYFRAEHITDERIQQVRALAKLAAERGQSIAQLALTWVLREGRVTSALVGASTPEQVRANAAAATGPELSPAEVESIERTMKVTP